MPTTDSSEISSSAGSSSIIDGISQSLQFDRFEDVPTQQEVLRLKLSDQICHRCGFIILDRFLSRVNANYYHQSCLRCLQCEKSFLNLETCFIKDDQIFCRDDYLNNFGHKCFRCMLPIRSDELIYKSRQNFYHTSCFHCFCCGKQLKSGDEYFYVETQLICREDYQFLQQNGHQQQQLSGMFPPGMTDLPFPSSSSSSSLPLPPFFPELEPTHHPRNSSKKIPKRPRTILNSHQRKAFKIAFDKGSKPTKKVREQLASETGLSVRVVQVWFQNQRAKIKKIQRKQGIQNCDPSENALSPDSKSDDFKSPSSSKLLDDSDLEDIDVDSGRSSSATIQRQNSSSSFFSPDLIEKDPMEKLYQMNSTYFAFA